MKKHISVLTLVLLVLFTKAQVVRPVNNPVLNGALINAKEVGDRIWFKTNVEIAKWNDP